MKPKIAYLDDDIHNLNFYREMLAENFSVDTFIRPNDLMTSVESVDYDCLILDIYLPTLNGFQVMERIRTNARYLRTPVFFITTNSDDQVKVNSFKNGAADFFDRMIKKDELVSRIEARIKNTKEGQSQLKLGNLALDLLNLECAIGAIKIDLTLIEFKMLSKLLLEHPRRMTKADFTQKIWGSDALNTNNLNSHLYNLRLKLSSWDHVIENHRTQGYWVEAAQQGSASRKIEI